MYVATTRQIKISVRPDYLSEQSDPLQSHYVWAYHIVIENLGTSTVQLLSRHWRITDEGGHTVEVRGDGVVGKQPVLAPGERFEYTSGTPLSRPSGIMVGSYLMRAGSGEQFEVDVPAFSLDLPQSARKLH